MATEIAEVRNNHILYPWAEWTNGKAWRAKAGHDFHCAIESFASSVYQYAYRHNLGVRVSISDAAVEFQFTKRKR